MVTRISFCLSCYNSIIAQPEHPSSPTIGYPAAREKSNLGEPAFGLVIVLNTLTHTHFFILVSFGDAYTVFKIMGSEHHRVIRPARLLFCLRFSCFLRCF